MLKSIEKIIYVAVGIFSGMAIGFTLLTFPIDFIIEHVDLFIIALIGIIGGLVSAILQFYLRYRLSKRSDVMRNETTALITHEMRTSLTSTSWAISYILKIYEKTINETDKKMLDGIIKSIHTTVMHTVNLLDTSLLDIGKLSISLEWLPLDKVGQMIGEVIEKYKMGIEGQDINLVSKIDLNHNDKVEVDILRLRIIIENLLENSIQYVSGDNKEIKVEVNNTKTTLNLIVSDNGIGIPVDEQSKIFGEFYRASNARRKLSSGSGIGLHMCEKYVKAHHGTIRFESTAGKGTAFYITLPLKTSADVNEYLRQV